MGIKRDSSDKWFSDAVRHRANYCCEHCHKGFEGLVQGFECCHIYGRANKSTRWSADNAVALCGGCHRHFTEHPLAFYDFLLEHLGQGHLDLLREKKNSILKTNRTLRLEIAKHYRSEFRRMGEERATDLVSWN
tara:strand:+ start:1262 stop:1663 length:402 start_codon:yes stop_codon:yes gene_type:complete